MVLGLAFLVFLLASAFADQGIQKPDDRPHNVTLTLVTDSSTAEAPKTDNVKNAMRMRYVLPEDAVQDPKCPYAGTLLQLLAMLLEFLHHSSESEKVNKIIAIMKTYLENAPLGRDRDQLFYKIKLVEDQLQQNNNPIHDAFANTPTNEGSKTTIVFKQEVPNLGQPNCQAEFSRLMQGAYNSYIERSKYQNCHDTPIFTETRLPFEIIFNQVQTPYAESPKVPSQYVNPNFPPYNNKIWELHKIPPATPPPLPLKTTPLLNFKFPENDWPNGVNEDIVELKPNAPPSYFNIFVPNTSQPYNPIDNSQGNIPPGVSYPNPSSKFNIMDLLSQPNVEAGQKPLNVPNNNIDLLKLIHSPVNGQLPNRPNVPVVPNQNYEIHPHNPDNQQLYPSNDLPIHHDNYFYTNPGHQPHPSNNFNVNGNDDNIFSLNPHNQQPQPNWESIKNIYDILQPKSDNQPRPPSNNFMNRNDDGNFPLKLDNQDPQPNWDSIKNIYDILPSKPDNQPRPQPNVVSSKGIINDLFPTNPNNQPLPQPNLVSSKGIINDLFPSNPDNQYKDHSITENGPGYDQNQNYFPSVNLPDTIIDKKKVPIVFDRVTVNHDKIPYILEYIASLKNAGSRPNIGNSLSNYGYLVDSNHASPDLSALGVTNSAKLNNPGIIELTYVLKRPQPLVYHPVYYVKYRLPYSKFVENFNNLILQKPFLRSEPKNIYNELITLSNITEVSPDLEGYDKEDIIKLMVHNGTLVTAKLINGKDNALNEQLEIIQDLNSNSNPNEISQLVNETISKKEASKEKNIDDKKNLNPNYAIPSTGGEVVPKQDSNVNDRHHINPNNIELNNGNPSVSPNSNMNNVQLINPKQNNNPYVPQNAYNDQLTNLIKNLYPTPNNVFNNRPIYNPNKNDYPLSNSNNNLNNKPNVNTNPFINPQFVKNPEFNNNPSGRIVRRHAVPSLIP